MNKLSKLYDALPAHEQFLFIGSCFAKARSLQGVPRIVLLGNDLTNESLENFFTSYEDYLALDKKYDPFITDEIINELNELNFIGIFDITRMFFDQDDELASFMSEDQRKKYNINNRKVEQVKFILSNQSHYDKKKSLCEQVIYKKLNIIWQSKWCLNEFYLGDPFKINVYTT